MRPSAAGRLPIAPATAIVDNPSIALAAAAGRPMAFALAWTFAASTDFAAARPDATERDASEASTRGTQS